MEIVRRGSRGWSPSGRNNQRALRRANQYFCHLDDALLSFVMVFLALLIIEMLWAPLLRYRGLMPLVKSSHAVSTPGAQREDAIHVAVSASGDVYFGISKIESADLPVKFREALQAGAEKRIYLGVDARAHYGDVKLVLDEIRLAGITNVTFITQ